MAENRALVVDMGSGVCKAGFADEEEPKATFHSLVGYPKIKGKKIGGKDYYVGSTQPFSRDLFSVHYPIEHGKVIDWDSVERIWDYLYREEFCASPKSLVTEAPLNPKANKERTAQLLFEKFNIPSLYLASPTLLALYAYGQDTGLVVDCGDGMFQTRATYGGTHFPASVMRVDLRGRDLTHNLVELLVQERGYYAIFRDKNFKIAEAMKENLAYIALDYKKEMNTPGQEKVYTLPDGSKLSVAKERFRCVEPLFQPHQIRKHETPGIHQATYNSVMKCAPEIQAQIFGNIFLAGGTTTIPGFEERFQKELTSIAPYARIKVTASPERKIAAWLGGTVVATLSSFNSSWLSKADYAEHGAARVHNKFNF